MERQVLYPKDEAEWLKMRSVDITSTEIGALFGITSASYIPTLFELWHRKKNNFAVEFEPNDRVTWGNRLQDAIAKGVAEDNGWNIRKMTEYVRDNEFRIGSSFDFSIEPKHDGPINVGEIGILEVKNVDSMQLKQKWIIDDENIEAPEHIELQIQHQLLVSGRAFGYIAALVGGNKVILIRRERNVKVHEAIKRKAKEFWDSIERNEPPKPNFSLDADFISKLYGYSEPGKVLKSDNDGKINDLISIYKNANEKSKEFDAIKESAKAEILTLIQDAEKVIGSNWTISAGLVGPAHIEYDRKPYRSFRISFKKQKGEQYAA